MATIKEADRGPSIQSTEVLKAEQNSFARFLEENNETFDRHSFLTYELRDEEQGRRNSPTLDAIAEKAVELASLLYPQTISRANSKAMRRVRRQISDNTTKFIFGNSSEKDRLITNLLPQALSAQRRLTSQSNVLTMDLTESLDDFRKSYHEATAPLVSGIRESKAELMGRFEEYLLSNPSNIFAFGHFLSDKKNHGAKIEAIRPFLASLFDSEQSLARDKKEGIVHRAAKKWSDELKEKPNPATIDQFAASIKSKSPNIREWLEFAAQGEDIANFLKSRPDVSTWTTELREALFSFVSSRYITGCSFIERELGELRRLSISKPTLPSIDFELENVKRASGKIAVKKEQDVEDKTPEAAERAKYLIGILTKEIGSSFNVKVLTEEELTGHLQKEADSLAPADQRMMADLEKMFSSLRKDPYGLGTEKFPVHTVGVENRRIPLRSFNSRKRIGLSHDHPDSHHLRIVYAICKNNAGSIIGLEGIYRHDDYLKRFT